MRFRIRISPRIFRVAIGLTAIGLASGGWAQQPAYRADAFTDFVGINASPFDRYLDSGPFAGAGTKYTPETFFELGVRHYRTGLFNDLVKPDAPESMKAAWKMRGAQPLLLIDPHKTKTPADVLAKVKAFDPRVIGGIEGPNEVNNKFPPQELNLRYGGKTDEAAGGAFMRDVYAALKADAQTRLIPVVAFTAIFTDYRLARPHAGFDYANIHPYQGYDVPSSSLMTNETRFNRILPAGAAIKPFIATECGYNVEVDKANGTLGTGSFRAQALNLPILLAEYFRHGIERAYLFALHNADGYGLIESDQKTKRPAYFALKNLLAIVKDAAWNPETLRWEGGDGFSPRALLFSIEGAPPSVHSLTLQKREGEYLLLIWNEVGNFDPETRKDLFPEPVPVDLRFQDPVPSEAEVLRQNDRGEYEARSVHIANGTLRLDVPSAVSIVRIPSKLARETTPLPEPANLRGEASENAVRLSWEPPEGSEVEGYFVFRNDCLVAAPRETSLEDTSEWIRPGLGYRYAVQAFDRAGRMSPRIETVIQTARKFPDLVISRLDLPTVRAGGKVRFRVTIANAGDVATPNRVIVGATFLVDGTPVSWGGYHGPPLEPGQVVEVIADGGPKGSADWTASAGAHLLQVKLDDVNRIPDEISKANNEADRTLWVDVTASGLLLGASDPAPYAVNLTSEGSLDWVHWGFMDKLGVVRKVSGGGQIGDVKEVGKGHLDATTGSGVRVEWDDGDTVKVQPGTNASLWLNGVGHGCEFSAPADKRERLLKVYVSGIEGARGELVAHLSDESAPDYVSTTWDGNRAFDWAPVPGRFTAVYTLRYRAAAARQKLMVRWVLVQEPNRLLGQVGLQAATLAPVN